MWLFFFLLGAISIKFNYHIEYFIEWVYRIECVYHIEYFIEFNYHIEYLSLSHRMCLSNEFITSNILSNEFIASNVFIEWVYHIEYFIEWIYRTECVYRMSLAHNRMSLSHNRMNLSHNRMSLSNDRVILSYKAAMAFHIIARGLSHIPPQTNKIFHYSVENIDEIRDDVICFGCLDCHKKMKVFFTKKKFVKKTSWMSRMMENW